MHTPAGFTPMHVTPSSLSETTLAFAFVGGKLLIRGNEQAPSCRRSTTWSANMPVGSHHYLGGLARRRLRRDRLARRGGRARRASILTGLRALFLRLPEATLALAARAFQVVEWDRTHRFCGRCGTPTHDKPGERAKLCPACGYVAYPRVSPAMMVLVTRDREVLLARANRFPKAMYSALAGFVEPGETIEDCIHREVREEVGIDVQDLQYFASQSWAFPHSLMIAYTADTPAANCGPTRPRSRTPAGSRRRLPDLPTTVSISRRLIDATRRAPRASERRASVPLESRRSLPLDRRPHADFPAHPQRRCPVAIAAALGVRAIAAGGAGSARHGRGERKVYAEALQRGRGPAGPQAIRGGNRQARRPDRGAAARTAGALPERCRAHRPGQGRRSDDRVPRLLADFPGIAGTAQQSRGPSMRRRANTTARAIELETRRARRRPITRSRTRISAMSTRVSPPPSTRKRRHSTSATRRRPRS